VAFILPFPTLSDWHAAWDGRNTTNYLEKATKEPATNSFVENTPLLIAKSPPA
jgi:hypothetical protein